MAEQSPLTGYEPNGPVEVGTAEVTTMPLSSRKTSTVHTGARQVQSHSGFTTLADHTFQRVRESMCSHKRKSSRDSNVLQESYPETEREDLD